MALGDTGNKVLYEGQMISYADYLIKIGQGPRPIVIPSNGVTGVVAEGYDHLTTGEVVKAGTSPDAAQNTAPPGALNIVRAVRQDDGSIAYQIAADERARALGVITEYHSTKNTKLSNSQRQQLDEYIKAHPEQQSAKRTADMEIEYYNAYGVPVYKGEKDPLDIAQSDPFKSGNQSLAETQKDDVTNSAPLVIPFYYGGATQNMGLLMPDTMIYPSSQSKRIYPAKIPLSMTEDPASGFYAVGVEGTVQSNVYFDPDTQRFYSRFLSEPTLASDYAVFSRDEKGFNSGVQSVQLAINTNEQTILLNPLNKDWVKNNVKMTVEKPENYQSVRMQSPEEMAVTPVLTDSLLNTGSTSTTNMDRYNDAIKFLADTDISAMNKTLNSKIAAKNATQSDYDNYNMNVEKWNNAAEIANAGPYVAVLKDNNVDGKRINGHNPLSDFLLTIGDMQTQGIDKVPTIPGLPDWVVRDPLKIPGNLAMAFGGLGVATQTVTEIAIQDTNKAVKVAQAGAILAGAGIVSNALKDPTRTGYNLAVGAVAGGVTNKILVGGKGGLGTIGNKNIAGGVRGGAMDGFYNPASGGFDLTLKADTLAGVTKTGTKGVTASGDVAMVNQNIYNIIGNTRIGIGSNIGKTVVGNGDKIIGGMSVGIGSNIRSTEIKTGSGVSSEIRLGNSNLNRNPFELPEIGLPGDFSNVGGTQNKKDDFLQKYGFRPGNAYKYLNTPRTTNNTRNKNTNRNADLNREMDLNQNMNLNKTMDLNQNMNINNNININPNLNVNENVNENETRNENRNKNVEENIADFRFGYGYPPQYKNRYKFRNDLITNNKPVKTRPVSRAKVRTYSNNIDAIMGVIGDGKINTDLIAVKSKGRKKKGRRLLP